MEPSIQLSAVGPEPFFVVPYTLRKDEPPVEIGIKLSGFVRRNVFGRVRYKMVQETNSSVRLSGK